MELNRNRTGAQTMTHTAERNHAATDYRQTLRAIEARITGNFDNPALLACGPLTDTMSDVLRFARDCLEAGGTDERPTPRTDDVYLNVQQADEDTAFCAMHDHAKALELDLASLRAERDALRAALEKLCAALKGAK